MVVCSSELADLCALVPDSEIFSPGQKEYATASTPWSIAAEKHPAFVVQPSTLETLLHVVASLYTSSLDFAVRNSGTGSASARDVVLSMKGFRSLSFSSEAAELLVGAGCEWGEVDVWTEQQAPGWAVLGARCGWVGVTGSALVGGLSRLSHEFGLISDPQNLLDMQVVLSNGRVVWASEQESELIWALRGGGGNFGVVTALKLRARPFPLTVFSGVLALPYTSLQAVSRGAAAMARLPSDPKVAMDITNLGPGLGLPDPGPRLGLAIIMFDARDEQHARDEAFAWAFALPGAHEVAGAEMSLRAVHAIAETFCVYNGNGMFWASAPLVKDLDDELVVRAWRWYEDCVESFAGFGERSTVFLQFMQENVMNSSGSRNATAWPHSGRKHVMQLVLGCKANGAPPGIQEIVMTQLHKSSQQIRGQESAGEFYPGFLHEWNDVREVFGEKVDGGEEEVRSAESIQQGRGSSRSGDIGMSFHYPSRPVRETVLESKS